MLFKSELFWSAVALAVFSAVAPCRLPAQAMPSSAPDPAIALPDAPQPQFAVVASQEPTPTPQQNPSQPAPASPADSPSSQTGPQTSDEKMRQQKAEEQIKEQEHQRVMGVIPSFNISYRSDTVSMTAGQKIKLAFHSATDPVTFATAFLVAGWSEAADSDSGFPWGAKGYFERSGAKYLDAFDG